MENLRINRNGFFENETHRECTFCGCIFEKRKEGCRMKICKPCNSLRVQRSQSPELKMWRRAANRAKEQQLAFDILVDDIVIPDVCPVLGIPLVINKGKSGGGNNSPSLDKIIPELGYVRGNIQVISQLANVMKFNATKEQLLLFANWVIETYS